MPARAQSKPASLSSRIRLWLLDNPGAHRPASIAAGLGVPADRTKQSWTQRVASECARMAKPGPLGRRQTLDRVTIPDWWGSAYQLAPSDEPAQASTTT